MKTYIDCIPCFMNQALRAGRISTSDDIILKKIMDNVGGKLKDVSLTEVPPRSAMIIYDEIFRQTGIEDPYKKIKKESIDLAKSILGQIRNMVESAPDPLLAAVKAAIAGNIIDFGACEDFDIKKDVKASMDMDLSINDYEVFKEKINNARTVLYLGDNAGETVFDRLLIENIDARVVYAVREKPIINDAVIEDAVDSGLADICEIISSGSTAPATILEECNERFLGLYHGGADIIISKGQGNYESLSDSNENIFFLLKTKCSVIARDLDTETGALVLKAGKNYDL